MGGTWRALGWVTTSGCQLKAHMQMPYGTEATRNTLHPTCAHVKLFLYGEKMLVHAVFSTGNSCLFFQHLDFIEKLPICFATAFQYLKYVFSTDLQLPKAPAEVTSPLKFPG